MFQFTKHAKFMHSEHNLLSMTENTDGGIAAVNFAIKQQFSAK